MSTAIQQRAFLSEAPEQQESPLEVSVRRWPDFDRLRLRQQGRLLVVWGRRPPAALPNTAAGLAADTWVTGTDQSPLMELLEFVDAYPEECLVHLPPLGASDHSIRLVTFEQPATTGRELAWFLRERSRLSKTELSGQWIAVVGDSVVASGPTLAEVLQEARRKGHRDPFVAAIPRAEFEEASLVG